MWWLLAKHIFKVKELNLAENWWRHNWPSRDGKQECRFCASLSLSLLLPPSLFSLSLFLAQPSYIYCVNRTDDMPSIWFRFGTITLRTKTISKCGDYTMPWNPHGTKAKRVRQHKECNNNNSKKTEEIPQRIEKRDGDEIVQHLFINSVMCTSLTTPIYIL